MSEQKESAQQAEAVEGEMGLLDQIMTETKIKPSDEGYSVAKKGVEALIAEMLTPQNQGEKVNKASVDQMIAAIDEKLSVQVDQILLLIHISELTRLRRNLYAVFCLK